MASTIATKRVDTSQLKPGDIVRTWGMRVRIDEVREYDTDLGAEHTAWSCPGTVINVDEVRAAGIVPMGWLSTEKFVEGQGWVTDRSTCQWTVQGNTLATWTVEISETGAAS